jgi:probable phosphoglycerate mutase
MHETTILLLRHAESADPARVLGAETDLPLSPRGEGQAAAVARWLAARGPSAVYASALRRAADTAKAIAECCGREVRTVVELHERRMGALSGRVRAEVWDEYRGPVERWKLGDLDAASEGSESFNQVRDRFVRALERIARDHPGETLAIVAHGMAIRVALASLLPGAGPAALETFGIDNASVNELVFDGKGWRAVSLNQSAPASIPAAAGTNP